MQDDFDVPDLDEPVTPPRRPTRARSSDAGPSDARPAQPIEADPFGLDGLDDLDDLDGSGGLDDLDHLDEPDEPGYPDEPTEAVAPVPAPAVAPAPVVELQPHVPITIGPSLLSTFEDLVGEAHADEAGTGWPAGGFDVPPAGDGDDHDGDDWSASTDSPAPFLDPSPGATFPTGYPVHRPTAAGVASDGAASAYGSGSDGGHDDDGWANEADDDEIWVAAPALNPTISRVQLGTKFLLAFAFLCGMGAVVAGLSQIREAEEPAPIPDVPFSIGDRQETAAGIVSLPAGGPVGDEVVVIPAVSTPAAGPSTVSVPDLGIETKMVETDIVDNALVIPDDVRTVTRYVGGAEPGDPTGTVLVAGHVSSKRQGRGSLYPLSTIQPGTVITVTDKHGVAHDYATVGLITTGKDSLPADLFSKEGEPRLVLITCGGPLERTPTGASSFRDNVIVTARPIVTAT